MMPDTRPMDIGDFVVMKRDKHSGHLATWIGVKVADGDIRCIQNFLLVKPDETKFCEEERRTWRNHSTYIVKPEDGVEYDKLIAKHMAMVLDGYDHLRVKETNDADAA